MDALPSRWRGALELAAGAALAGGAGGLSEAARELAGGTGWHQPGSVAALLVAGSLGGAALAVLATLPLAGLPPRPAGRSRWLGFCAGLGAWTLLALWPWWFAAPAPFTESPWWREDPLVFSAIATCVATTALALYQGARGERATAAAALAATLGLAAWAQSAGRVVPPPEASPPPGAPNVLLVTLDTARADHFGALGSAEVATPRFDALAAAGALYTQASAVAPVTGPSHASMFFGQGPWEHGVLLNGLPLPADRESLAEVLRANGYATAAFVSAFVLDGKTGFSRGFDVYDDDFTAVPGLGALAPARLLAMGRRHARPDAVLERRGAETVDRAMAWLDTRQGPWFCWVHLFDPHGPYAPPPPYDTRYAKGDPRDPANASMSVVKDVNPYMQESLRGITDLDYVLGQYAGEISYADSQLGRLVDAVDPVRTLVAVIGDHGESLGEHGTWFDHGQDVFETSVHVPFAMRWPGRIAPAKIFAPAEGSDLAPSVLGLVGILPPSTMRGRALLGVSGQGPTAAAAPAIATPARSGKIDDPKFRMVTLRDPARRYVLREYDHGEWAFDLAADPSGVTDARALFEQGEDGQAWLRERRGLAEILLGRTLPEVGEISAEDKERLGALGYLDEP
jgi:arylsulfatase A-like enzyme